MDQQKQPTAPDTKTGAGVQPAQQQQQKGNAQQNQGDKRANPASGHQPPPAKEAPASTNATSKAL